MLYPDLKHYTPKPRNSVGGEFKTIEADLKRKYGDEIVDELRETEERRSGAYRDGTSNGDRRRGGGRFNHSNRDGMNQTSINTFFSKKGGATNNTGSSSLATLDDNDMWDDGESAGPSVPTEAKPVDEKVEPTESRRSPSVEIVSSDYSHRSKDSKDDWDREERRPKKRKTSTRSRDASSDRSRTPRDRSREKSQNRSKGKSHHKSRDRSRSRERHSYRSARSRSREYDDDRRRHRKSRSRTEEEDDYKDRRSRKRYGNEYEERPSAKRPPSPVEEFSYGKAKRVSHYERPSPVPPQKEFKPSYGGGRKFNSYEPSSTAGGSLLSNDDMWDDDAMSKPTESSSSKTSDYAPPPPPPPTSTKTPPPPPPIGGESGYSSSYSAYNHTSTQSAYQPPPPPSISPPREKVSSKKPYDYLFEAPVEKPSSQYEHKKSSTSSSNITAASIPVKSITAAQFSTAAQIHATLQKLNAAMSSAARNGSASSSSSSTSSLAATLAAMKKSSSSAATSASLNNSSSSSSNASTSNATIASSSSSTSTVAVPAASPAKPPSHPEVVAGGKLQNIQLEQEKVSKKNLADVVIRFLMPYYRQQKIKSKELFKGLARNISHKFYDVEVVVDRKVKKYIDDLMTHKGVIASEADFPN